MIENAVEESLMSCIDGDCESVVEDQMAMSQQEEHLDVASEGNPKLKVLVDHQEPDLFPELT